MFALFALAGLVSAQQRTFKSGIPVNAVLNAPFTPFKADLTLNLEVIPHLARDAYESGVNVVWVAGGMGQFDALTIAERKTLAAAWVTAARPFGLYMIIHVGTTVQADAIELAAHARAIGAQAIASVPPYYTHGSPEEVVNWFAPVVAASNHLPFFYYHIPGSTGATFSMTTFFPLAIARLPSFAGVKFVSNDNTDFFRLQRQYGSTLSLMFAPEPKMQGLGLGAQGSILAESFFAPTWLRMCHAWVAGNMREALREQEWKDNVANVFSRFKGQSERVVYALKGIDIGPPRPPAEPMAANQYEELRAALDKYNFFNQTVPGPCLPNDIYQN